MRPKKYRISLAAFSVLFISACGSGPKVTICVSDPANNGFQCVDHKKKSFFLPYADSENYLALSPDDAKLLLDYCKAKDK